MINITFYIFNSISKFIDVKLSILLLLNNLKRGLS
jgi:hypothetical protein